MYHMGMIPDPPVPPAQPARELKSDFWRINSEGMAYLSLGRNEFVHAGDPTGVARDWLGTVTDQLVAPCDGWVMRLSRLSPPGRVP